MKQRLLFLSDLKALLFLIRKPLLRVALCCVLLTFCLLVWKRPPLYLATATFQQAQGKYEEGPSLQSVLRSMRFYDEESSAASAMQSKRLIGSVCKQLGLQFVEGNFASVDYRGEEVLKLFLRPLSEGRFELLDQKKQLLGQGELGKPLETALFSCMLLAMPEKETRLTLIPLADCINMQRRQLKIKSSRVDAKLLELSFSHPQRKVAEAFLDGLMKSFQDDLVAQHAQLAEMQLAFLSQRREELQNTYDCALQEHAAYLKNTLGQEGLIAFTQQVDNLTAPEEDYSTRLDALDLDLKRWHEINRSSQILVQGSAEPSMQLASHSLDLAPPFDPQFVGIDLPTAQKFYAEYSCQRDALMADLKQLSYLRTKMVNPSFEITALTKVMDDPISQEMIQQAAQIALQLCDEGNRSLKEQERLKEALDAQKRFIHSHVNRTMELSKMKLDLVDRKMAGLQKAAIELIKNERGILQDKLQELQSKMHTLPERWRLENQLKLKREMTLLIMEGMAQLTESKLVDHHLFAVSSRPIDRGFSPPTPVKRHLLLYSLIGGLVGAFAFFLYELLRRAPNRLPFSPPSLQALGAKVLEQRRLLSHLLDQKPQVIALFYSLKGLQSELEASGYTVKVVDAKSVHLAHKETAALVASWRSAYDFILIEASLEDAQDCIKLADRFISPIASHEKLEPLIESAITKTIFIHEKENSSDGWSRFFGLPSMRRAAQARP